MFERFTDRARNVLVDAQAAARRLGHGYIGTEHILLALLQGDGIAARVLGGLGITPAAVEREVLAEVGRGPFGQRDAEALGAIGIDLEEVRRRVEASFGPGALVLAARPCMPPGPAYAAGRRAHALLARGPRRSWS